MNDINQLIETFGIPFNRSERHFTGTILSILLSQDNFKGLGRVIEKMAPGLSLTPEYSETQQPNILFFTEYDYKRSQFSNGRAPEGSVEVRGDTPDVLWFVRANDTKYLFAIEAKMFDKPNTAALERQMKRQWVILKEMAKAGKVPEDHIIHFALVPEKYKRQLTNISNALTWETILELYRATGNKYCIDTLEYAIAHYDELVGQSKGGNNCTGKYTGQRIVADYRLLNIKYVGCGGGLNGLKKHVEANTWRDFPFEVIEEEDSISEKDMPKKNWFTINDFLAGIN